MFSERSAFQHAAIHDWRCSEFIQETPVVLQGMGCGLHGGGSTGDGSKLAFRTLPEIGRLAYQTLH
jgi:hypothetical protein